MQSILSATVRARNYSCATARWYQITGLARTATRGGAALDISQLKWCTPAARIHEIRSIWNGSI